MIYLLAITIAIDWIIITALTFKLKLALEKEKEDVVCNRILLKQLQRTTSSLIKNSQTQHSKEYLKDYNQAILDDVVNDYEDSLKDMFKKNNNKGETK